MPDLEVGFSRVVVTGTVGRTAATAKVELPETEEFKIAVALEIPDLVWSLDFPVLIAGDEEGNMGGIPLALTVGSSTCCSRNKLVDHKNSQEARHIIS